ncbi:MAG: glycosyl hydrolase family 18 protein, partial [Lentisphaeria bacterium]
YYGDWSVWGGQGNFYPQHIPADQLTHLNFAFLDFDSQANLIFTDKDAATGNPLGQPGVTWGDVNAGILPALVELRAKNPNLKIGISIGGWSKSGDFSAVAASASLRAKFVANVLKFIKYTNMDFVDIDWEYPAFVREADLVDNKNDEGTIHSKPEDKNNYIALLQDFKDALNKQGVELGKKYELSVALPADKAKLEAGVDIGSMFDIIDFGNLMTYDMRGAWDDTSGHQAPLFANPKDPHADKELNIAQTVSYMMDRGAPANKLIVGAAYYTRGWEQVSAGNDQANPGLFGEAALVAKDADKSATRGAANEAPLANGDGGRRGGVWSYRSIDKLKATYPALQEFWDDHAKAPYLYDPNNGAFFTYDNVRSIQAKAEYVNQNSLGGIIAWMASNDAPTTSEKRDELTNATKKALFGDGKLSAHEIIYNLLDVSVAIKTYEESWGNSSGFEISITNNEKLEESGEVLSLTEKMAETITLPKFYLKYNGPSLVSGDYTAGTVTSDGDYVVVDLASIYDGKAIEPGRVYDFKLKSSGKVSIEDIESIELVQRITKDGSEIKRQFIYGNIDLPNQAPVIMGIEDKSITVGESFNPLAGVTAHDKEDGTITEKIVVSGSVNTAVAGEYLLTYLVTDSEGLTTTVLRKITVTQYVNQAPELFGISDLNLFLGDIFDPMTNVTAYDQEDGVLTHKIIVTGSVDTNIPGEYFLNYAVVDSENLATTAVRKISVQEEESHPELPDADFGVGKGITWEAQVNAPYVDMAAWTTQPDYNNNGAPNLVKIAQDTDVFFFNLGFIQAVGTEIKDNKVVWGWAGLEALSETGGGHSQYDGIKKSIKELREIGGDVTISLGGLNGVAIWQASSDVEILTNTYLDIVNGYGLTRIDFDIEGHAQDKNYNTYNARAIKKVQAATGVKVVLTLPVNPDGLAYEGRGVLETFLTEGVDIEVLNIMTMCYGPANLLPGENYGSASLRAVDSTKNQLKDYYAHFANTILSDADAYAKIGTTPSIGFEGSAHPIFTKEWAELVVDHAIANGLAMTSFWSMNRDAKIQDNQGVNYQYEFTEIFKMFDDETVVVNKAPQIIGAMDKTITIGSDFDPREGVTAIDREDGDISHFIEITGSVNTHILGSYPLLYSVTDSEGLETSISRIITVEPKINNAPQISGVRDITITAGDLFDPFAGVSAFDKEDGDLTNYIEIQGEVDVNV